MNQRQMYSIVQETEAVYARVNHSHDVPSVAELQAALQRVNAARAEMQLRPLTHVEMAALAETAYQQWGPRVLQRYHLSKE